jgi:hypothetical protein
VGITANLLWGERGFMSVLEDSLRRVLAVDGVRVAALVDIATGMVVRSAGDAGPGFAEAAAGVAEEARACRALLGAGSPGGELDEFSVLTTSRIHLARVLSGRAGEGLVLFADLDRARGNLALASLRVGQVAPAVLA